jgi:hypothetical protein
VVVRDAPGKGDVGADEEITLPATRERHLEWAPPVIREIHAERQRTN